MHSVLMFATKILRNVANLLMETKFYYNVFRSQCLIVSHPMVPGLL